MDNKLKIIVATRGVTSWINSTNIFPGTVVSFCALGGLTSTHMHTHTHACTLRERRVGPVQLWQKAMPGSWRVGADPFRVGGLSLQSAHHLLIYAGKVPSGDVFDTSAVLLPMTQLVSKACCFLYFFRIACECQAVCQCRRSLTLVMFRLSWTTWFSLVCSTQLTRWVCAEFFMALFLLEQGLLARLKQQGVVFVTTVVWYGCWL